MKRSAFASRIGRIVGLLVLLSVLVASVGVPFPLRSAGGQQPRPTPTPGPGVALSPTQGVAGDATSVVATGVFWTPGGTVILYWDGTLEVSLAAVASDGTFQTTFTTPTGPGYAAPGLHFVLAVQGGLQADAPFLLLQPTPTDTPPATYTNTPVTPTNTSAPTVTGTPEPTLRPVTPIVTGTVTRWAPQPTPLPTRIPRPTNTSPPKPPAPTNTPRPSATPTFTPSPTPTDTPTATPTPTPTDTPTLTPTPTPTDTPTSTPTPTPTDTPTSTGTPTPASGTPVPGLPTPPAEGGTPSGGGSWESIFFQGFIAAILLIVLLTGFIIVLLVLALVAWRIMRMRRVPEGY